ncbi:unnamed protein product, partial [Cylicostephanus goldi]
MNSTIPPLMTDGMAPADDDLIELMQELLSVYLILGIIGFVGVLFNIPLMYTLL